MKYSVFIFVLFSLSILLFSCKSNNSASEKYLDPRAHKIDVKEVLQTSMYTYLRGDVDGKETWLAISRQEVEKGKTYYYINEMEMKDFASKELKRTFESILFVQHFSPDPILPEKGKSPGSKELMPEKEKVEVAPVEGGITIGKLYDEKQQWVDKQVFVSGKVMKFNAGIMDRNWVHLQDGTSSGENYDLTITTLEQVKVGDIVTFEGKLVADKDFGAGYVYALLLEDASQRKK